VTSSPPPVSSPSWSSRTKRTVALICLALAAFVFLQLTEILPIIGVALVLSYLLYPIAKRFDRLTYPRTEALPRSRSALAIIVTFLLVVAFFSVIVLLVFPVLLDQLQEFLTQIPALLQRLWEDVRVVLSQPIEIAGQVIVPIESLEEALGFGAARSDVPSLSDINIPETVTMFVRSLTGPAFSFLGGAVNAVINFIFLLTLMFYLIKDGPRFVDAIVDITPPAYKGDARRLFYELRQVWDAYLRGQVILSLIMGVVVFLAATILGVPNATILGTLSALLEFIPNIGPALALIPAALLALASQSSTLPFLEGPTFALVVIVVWTALQNIEAVVLVPRVMGGSLNLHPFVVMVAVLAGAAVGGALGVILAAPVVASIRVLGQYIYGKLMDRNPFPQPTMTQELRRQRGTFSYQFSRLTRQVQAWGRRAISATRSKRRDRPSSGN